MCKHNHLLAPSIRPIPNVQIQVDCEGIVYALDRRGSDPMRPQGLRRFVPTGTVLDAARVDCLAGEFAKGRDASQAWLASLTPDDVTSMVDAIPTGPLIR